MMLLIFMEFFLPIKDQMEGNYLYANLIVKSYNMLQCNKIILNLMSLKSPIKINSTGEKCLKYQSLESGISRTQLQLRWGFLVILSI